MNPDETGKKTLGSYYLKTAIRMLTDYIADLKTSHVSIDDSVQSRIEEYEALLRDLEEKQPEQDDSKTILATQDRGKLISMLLDYQAVLLSEALADQAQLDEDVPDRDESYAQDTEDTELRPRNEAGEDSEARRVPVYLCDTDFQEGGYKGPLTDSLALCENQVYKFESLLPCVVIFKGLCKYVVESLAARARLNFVQYRKILSHLEEVEGGGEISGSLRNSASFCFESLVGLARRFQLVSDLLTKCGSLDWYKSALELANVKPSRYKLRWSEFSLAIRNCQWSMDLAELAFHALQKLQKEGRYSVKDATFKWSEVEGRMVLQILSDSEIDRQSSGNQESSKLQEVCRDLEEKDLADLIEKLKELMASEKEKKPFYRDPSNAYEIAKYLCNKLSGPTPVVGAYLPYTFSTIEWPSLKYREYLDIGSSGMVAIHDWHKVQVAVKSVRCPLRARFEEEAAILGMVQHPNVVRLIGCGYIDKSDTGLLVMELMDHDLRFIIESRLNVLPEGANPFAPIVAIDIMLQIGQAMLYLREHNILHRDLKAKNVLVNVCKPLALQKEADSANTSLLRQYPAVSAVLPHTQENYVAKLADFGLAKCRPQSSFVHTRMAGTTGWRAPEVFNSPENDVYKWPADVYSFGMLCYEILTGKMPFLDELDHGAGLHAKIMAGVRPPLASISGRPDVPDGLLELIQQCWATNAAERPTFETIVKKLWECKVQAILPGFERQIMRSASSLVIT